MFRIDAAGKRSTNINGIDIKDYREIAYFDSENPKYKDKSLYLIPDQYIYDIKKGDKEPWLLKGDSAYSIVSEAKSKNGRSGRRIKNDDIDLVADILETDPEELEEYYKFMNKDVKKLFNKSKDIVEKLNFDREMIFNDLDYPSLITNPKNDQNDIHGELIPMPITNFTNEKLEEILKGKTKFWIESSKTGKPMEISLLGNQLENLAKNGYNGQPAYYKDENSLDGFAIIDEDFLEKSQQKGSKEENIISDILCEYSPSGEEMVEITYIYGPNRSGKTYYAAKYTTLWCEMFKDWPVFLFSRRDKDRVLDDIPNLNRIEIDQSLITNPLTMTDFEHSLVIFDDIDTIADKQVCKAIQKLRDDIMETGRQKMIYVINTSHLGMNWGPTRTVLNEANSYTLFPRKGNYEHNCKILENKMGIKKDVVKKILDRPDGIAHQGKWGWITVYKDSPQYIIWEKGVKLL